MLETEELRAQVLERDPGHPAADGAVARHAARAGRRPEASRTAMMHNRAGRKLRRTTSHRLAMFSNQLASLMTHERIQTTLSKAKELRPLAERLITAAKNDGVAARRKVAQWIPDRTTVKKVFEKIAPRFVDRPGGYTRILRLGARAGRQRRGRHPRVRGLPLRGQGQGAEEGIAFGSRPAGLRRTSRDRSQAEAGGAGGGRREGGGRSEEASEGGQAPARREEGRRSCPSRRPRRARAAPARPSAARRERRLATGFASGTGVSLPVAGLAGQQTRPRRPGGAALVWGSSSHADVLAERLRGCRSSRASRTSTSPSTSRSTRWRRSFSTGRVRWAGRPGFSFGARARDRRGAWRSGVAPTRCTRLDSRAVDGGRGRRGGRGGGGARGDRGLARVERTDVTAD